MTHPRPLSHCAESEFLFADEHQLVFPDQRSQIRQKVLDILLLRRGNVKIHKRRRLFQGALHRGNVEMQIHNVVRASLNQLTQLHQKPLLAELARDLDTHLSGQFRYGFFGRRARTPRN